MPKAFWRFALKIAISYIHKNSVYLLEALIIDIACFMWKIIREKFGNAAYIAGRAGMPVISIA